MKLFRTIWFTVAGLSAFIACNCEDLEIIIPFGGLAIAMFTASLIATYGGR